MSVELGLLVAAILLTLGVGATRASSRFGVPALILFLALGMLAGSEGPGDIEFNNAAIAQGVGTIALLFILYSGGLDTDWQNIKPVLAPGLVMATIGVGVSAVLMGLFARWVLDFTFVEGLLLGSIVSSTDAPAVFALLRTQGVHLRGRLEPMIEFESGSNDPMAVFLTSGLIGVLAARNQLISLAPSFLLQMGLGAVGGYLLGKAAVWVLNQARLQQEGLYSVLSLGLAMIGFAGLALIGGNGFLAIYVAGVVVGNARVVHKRSIIRFHEGVAWLMQIIMFLTLGLLVFPSQLSDVAPQGLLAALFLVFVARPVGVFACIFWAGFSVREMLAISWAGLRGAVPIVLATFPLLAGTNRAGEIFNIIFFVVLISVLLQGSTIRWVARWLGVEGVERRSLSEEHEFVPEVRLTSRLLPLQVRRGSALEGKQIFELGLPRGALVVQVQRGSESFVPNGSTVLDAGDQVLLLTTPDALASVQALQAVARRVTPTKGGKVK